MDVKTQLQALYELQMLDSAMDALKKQYALLDRGQIEQASYDTAKAAHTEATTALSGAQGALRDTELEQKAVEAKRAQEETRLYSGKIQAPKELQALQEEVEALQRQRGKLDEKLLVLMDDQEARRSREAQTKEALKLATKALRGKLNAYNVQSETIRAQAKELSAQRNAAAKEIPPDLLKRYEGLRLSKGGVAISPLIDGNACGGCRMGLPSSVVLQVRAGVGIIMCDNCERMLCEKQSG